MQVHVSGAAHAFLLAAVIAAAAAAAGLVTLLRGPVELRFFAGAAALVVAGGLVNPLVSPNGHQWDVLALTRGAGRYFFAAELAWLVVVIWLLTRIRLVWLRRIGLGAMAAAFASGLVLNWRYPALVDDHWPAEAQRILTAAPGTFLRLPIPPAPPWAVEITVHR